MRLAAVATHLAIISSGAENPHSHPHRELLVKLQENGSGILRTSQQGAVQALTDGHLLRVSCFVVSPASHPGLVQSHTPDCGQQGKQ
jgi:beta-lactamase superfamily II metal-dependent hydrolase